MRVPLLVANWKMNGNVALLDVMQQVLLGNAYPHVNIALCPPFVLLPQTQAKFSNTAIAYGAQDVSDQENGAYTGQISAQMLSQLACTYVIIGHSERRMYCAETDALIAAKCAQAQAATLIPILCVGENAQQKRLGQTQDVVLTQVRAVLDSLPTESIAQLVIAYEPIWAIGTGLAADPIAANAVHELIRSCVAGYDPTLAQNLRILYGGSVNAENIASFLAQTHIDGALIGGAALKPEVFAQMARGANQLSK
ncbi:MAG TPA: triose-phosphate isomerase [Gammaproteobacteria bacterium]|nr:triose-phosphate isomerase [Gammaproteobacteria bacterium]